jgi:thiol-disulfide isomerase/thioredoxin
MMIRKNLNVCIAGMVMLLSQDAYSQTVAGKTINAAEGIRSLTIGDKVPDIVIENIINYRNAAARISEFKGKLIIIDFWGTTCSNCIAALPKIDSLQKVYKDQMQVFTVTNYDTKEKVVETLKRYKKTQNLSLPVVLNDVKLKKYFPHEMVSHVVWINGEGMVKAITGTEYINAKNIETVLDGRDVNWPVKNDVFEFDYEKPFLNFSNSDLVQPEFMYSSAFTSYMDGVDGTDKLLVDSLKNIVTRNHFNHSLLQLCDGSLNGSGTGYINPKHLILEVNDVTRYIRDENNQYYAEWAKKNTYSYSITLPLGLSNEETREIIKTDLAHWLRVLGISVRKEKRMIKCLSLVRINKDDGLLKSKGGEYEYGLNETGSLKKLNNAGFANFVWQLNQETHDIPWVFDETGIPGDFKVDMTLRINSFKDIPALRKQLQRYGLDLLEVKREMEMYIIKEKEVKRS